MCECGDCPNTAQTTEWVDVYTEPTVNYPPEDSKGRKWGNTHGPPGGIGGDLACPSCLEKDEKPPPATVGMKTLDLGAKIAGQD